LIKDRLDVFPSVVEGCLLKHPNIKEAIVFGIPINDFEQEICAWVKLRSNEDKTGLVTPVAMWPPIRRHFVAI
jgi:acyl-CoA synthetase (AMP-forming)/AMP-acid ligase II